MCIRDSSTGELNDMLFELMGALTLAPLLDYDRAVRVMQREHAALLRDVYKRQRREHAGRGNCTKARAMTPLCKENLFFLI